MKRHILIPVIVVITGCHNSIKAKVEKVHGANLAELVAKLEDGDCVESRYNGVEKTPSETFAIYDSLLKVAPDSLWHKLTYDRNPVVRCYAYQALFTRNAPEVAQIGYRLENDTDSICYKENIYQLTGTVGWFIKRIKNKDTLINKVIVK